MTNLATEDSGFVCECTIVAEVLASRSSFQTYLLLRPAKEPELDEILAGEGDFYQI